MPDDFKANARTAGTVAVGGTATGTIETRRDVDWFAVELVGGRTYVIDLEGDDTGGGTLGNTMLSGLYDSDGERIAGTRVGYGGEGDNARLTFTASESGTYYIAARGQGGETGTYTVRVTVAVDPDATAAGAVDLGDLAGPDGARLRGSVDGGADGTDYYRFTLSETKRVELSLGRQDADADLYLEDGNGAVLYSSTKGGTGKEGIEETLQAGTYYVRVAAQEAGDNNYMLNAVATEPAVQPHAPPGEPRQEPQQQSVQTSVSEPDGEDFPADTSTKGRVAVGGSATGAMTWGDIDWFAVTLEKDTAYRIDVKGRGTGDGVWFPLLRGLYDADGNYIAGTYEVLTSRTFFTPSEDGIHYVTATHFGYGNGTYTVSVAEVGDDDFAGDTTTMGTVPVDGSVTGEIEAPHDRDWFAVTLEKGKVYRIDLKGQETGDGTLWDPYLHGIYDENGNFISGYGDDASGGDRNSRIYWSAYAGGVHYVAAGGDRGQTGTYTLSVAEIGTDDSVAALGKGGLGTVEVGGTATGKIDYSGDIDWFGVTLEAGKVYRIDLEGAPTEAGTLQDPLLRGVHYAKGGVLYIYGNAVAHTWNDNGGVDGNAQTIVKPDESGTYYIAASAHVGTGNTGTYSLSVTQTDFSEPHGEDFPADTSTRGFVAVGSSVTGTIPSNRREDVDWFAVTLEKGKTYEIHQQGSNEGKGTLGNPVLRGIHDADGQLIARTAAGLHGIDDSNDRVLFTPKEDGTYYVAAGVHEYNVGGTYTLSVAQVAADRADDYSAGTDTTGKIKVGRSATGEIENPGDHDWFSVALEKGQTYRIDLKGSPTGDGTLIDPRIHGIYDKRGNLLSGTWDDDGGVGRNGQVFFTPSADATYYVATSGYWKGTGTYTLSVAEGTDDFAAGIGTGREIGKVPVGGSATGKIDYSGDVDWFAFNVQAGKTYQIDLKGKRTGDGTLRDPEIRGIYDGAPNLIANTADDDGGQGKNSRTTFTAGNTEVYYVAAGGDGNHTGTYTLSVEEHVDAM